MYSVIVPYHKWPYVQDLCFYNENYTSGICEVYAEDIGAPTQVFFDKDRDAKAFQELVAEI